MGHHLQRKVCRCTAILVVLVVAIWSDCDYAVILNPNNDILPVVAMAASISSKHGFILFEVALVPIAFTLSDSFKISELVCAAEAQQQVVSYP